MKKVFCAAALFLLCVFTGISAAAEAAFDNAPIQAYTDRQMLDMFFSESPDINNIEVRISNQPAELVGRGSFGDSQVNEYITLMLDTSMSVPSAMRKAALDFIELKIRDIAPNEKIRIVTFGQETKVLQDFTGDRYELTKAMENVEFTSEKSMVYDALFCTIPDMAAVDGQPCYYQTILISDGRNYSAGVLTKEELYLLLKEKMCPIDVIRINSEESEKTSAALSALCRVSKGVYYEFSEETDISALSEQTDRSDYCWVRVSVDESLLDGSTRQVDVYDGKNTMSFDIKMYMGGAKFPAASEAPVAVGEWEKDDNDFEKTVLVVSLCIIAVIAGMVIWYVRKRCSDNAKRLSTSRPLVVPLPQESPREVEEERSEVFSCIPQYRESVIVNLSNLNVPEQTLSLNLVGEILIGRSENCTIYINDQTVSREQCRIMMRDNMLILANVSVSNVTRLNGIPVQREALLHPSDIINIGAVSLRVDSIQRTGAEPEPRERRRRNGEDTAMIFMSKRR